MRCSSPRYYLTNQGQYDIVKAKNAIRRNINGAVASFKGSSRMGNDKM